MTLQTAIFICVAVLFFAKLWIRICWVQSLVSEVSWILHRDGTLHSALESYQRRTDSANVHFCWGILQWWSLWCHCKVDGTSYSNSEDENVARTSSWPYNLAGTARECTGGKLLSVSLSWRGVLAKVLHLYYRLPIDSWEKLHKVRENMAQWRLQVQVGGGSLCMGTLFGCQKCSGALAMVECQMCMYQKQLSHIRNAYPHMGPFSCRLERWSGAE